MQTPSPYNKNDMNVSSTEPPPTQYPMPSGAALSTVKQPRGLLGVSKRSNSCEESSTATSAVCFSSARATVSVRCA